MWQHERFPSSKNWTSLETLEFFRNLSCVCVCVCVSEPVVQHTVQTGDWNLLQAHEAIQRSDRQALKEQFTQKLKTSLKKSSVIQW